MALSHEDKKDVSRHLGKALANKVSKVTRDKGTKFEHKLASGRTIYGSRRGMTNVFNTRGDRDHYDKSGQLHVARVNKANKYSDYYGNPKGDPAGDASHTLKR